MSFWYCIIIIIGTIKFQQNLLYYTKNNIQILLLSQKIYCSIVEFSCQNVNINKCSREKYAGNVCAEFDASLFFFYLFKERAQIYRRTDRRANIGKPLTPASHGFENIDKFFFQGNL